MMEEALSTLTRSGREVFTKFFLPNDIDYDSASEKDVEDEAKDVKNNDFSQNIPIRRLSMFEDLERQEIILQISDDEEDEDDLEKQIEK